MTSAPASVPPADDPFAALDATAQAALVRSGEARAVELVAAAIARIEALDGALNAVVSRRFEQALAVAEGPLPDAPFAGVPFLFKDLSAWAGAPLTFGSRFFRAMRARESEPVVRRCLEAGLIGLGKTNTPEFGLLASTEPLLFGPTRNPWDLEASPGGSSGGAAAAVAAGLTPIAHAGDGGGSIRIPASNCGLFGLKPSRGRCLTPNRPTPGELVAYLCVSRSVRDSARMLAICELDEDAACYPRLGFVAGPSSRRLRIAVSGRTILGQGPEPEVARALAAAARLCQELGHRVEEADPPEAGEEAVERFLTLWAAAPAEVMRLLWLLRLRLREFRPRARMFEPWTLALAERYRREERAWPGAAERAVAFFRRKAREFDAFHLRHDVLLTPVLRRPPARIGEQAPDVPFDTLLARSLDTVCYTPVQNAVGAPAMAVPLAMSADGLPIGLQFAAAPGGERMLLELAYELEAARPWAGRWPSIFGANESR